MSHGLTRAGLASHSRGIIDQVWICDEQRRGPLPDTLNGGGGEIPWSIKGNTIGRNLTIREVTADWLGVQFNWIARNATLTNITATDPGDPGRTIAVVENTVGRNLHCT